MVSSSLLLLSLLAAAPSSSLGIVRSPRGEVSIVETDGNLSPATVGRFVFEDQAIEVEEGAWVELLLPGDGRLRLGSGTRVRLARTPKGALVVLLQSGRLWAQKSLATDPAIEIHAPGFSVEVSPASSIVVEHSTLSGASCVVRAGEARVSADEGPRFVVRAGQIARRARPGETRIGGETIGELVSKEARAGLGDLVGLTAFIVSRTLGAKVADVDMRGVESLFQGDAQLMGGRHPSVIVERAVRPPPFEPTEVPRRGANVEVEVRFEER